MRQGNVFQQWVDRAEDGTAFLRLPLEVEQDWEGKTVVEWTDNGDGSYTLRPSEYT